MTYKDADKAIVRQKIINNTIRATNERWTKLHAPLEFTVVDVRYRVLLRRNAPSELLEDIIRELHIQKKIFLLTTNREKKLLLPATIHAIAEDQFYVLMSIEDYFYTTKLHGKKSPQTIKNHNIYNEALDDLNDAHKEYLKSLPTKEENTK